MYFKILGQRQAEYLSPRRASVIYSEVPERSCVMRKHFTRLFALSLTAAVFMAAAVPALAAVPDRPENMYVLDEAGVLDDATEREIIRGSEGLFEETGGEIAVVTVDFLDGQEIDDYAYDLFDVWEIGSSERNNGLLLLLAIGEDTYYAMPGYGIEEEFSGGVLQDMLQEYLEPDFAGGEYDAGVKKFYRAALEKMRSISYDDGYDDPYDDGYGDGYENYDGYDTSRHSFFRTVIRWLARLVMIVIVIAVIVTIISALSGGGRGNGPGSGGGGGGFWRGMFIGNMLGSRRHRSWYNPPPPPFGGPGPRPPRNGGGRPGGFGGFGGSGGFGGHSGGFSHGGRPGGHSGGFSHGGGSRGGGAGRR